MVEYVYSNVYLPINFNNTLFSWHFTPIFEIHWLLVWKEKRDKCTVYHWTYAVMLLFNWQLRVLCKGYSKIPIIVWLNYKPLLKGRILIVHGRCMHLINDNNYTYATFSAIGLILATNKDSTVTIPQVDPLKLLSIIVWLFKVKKKAMPRNK